MAYEYVRRVPSPRFTRSRSFSYHTRPRFSSPSSSSSSCRLPCPDSCACVTIDDWNDLSQRERESRERADKLRHDNRRLKEDLAALRDDTHRRRVTVLRAELENRNIELEDLRREREVADIRVREISQTLTEKNLEIDALSEKNRLLIRANKHYKHDLEVRGKEARDAWDIVGELQRRLDGFRHHPFSFRSYGYAT